MICDPWYRRNFFENPMISSHDIGSMISFIMYRIPWYKLSMISFIMGSYIMGSIINCVIHDIGPWYRPIPGRYHGIDPWWTISWDSFWSHGIGSHDIVHMISFIDNLHLMIHWRWLRWESWDDNQVLILDDTMGSIPWTDTMDQIPWYRPRCGRYHGIWSMVSVHGIGHILIDTDDIMGPISWDLKNDTMDQIPWYKEKIMKSQIMDCKFIPWYRRYMIIDTMVSIIMYRRYHGINLQSMICDFMIFSLYHGIWSMVSFFRSHDIGPMISSVSIKIWPIPWTDTMDQIPWYRPHRGRYHGIWSMVSVHGIDPMVSSRINTWLSSHDSHLSHLQWIIKWRLSINDIMWTISWDPIPWDQKESHDIVHHGSIPWYRPGIGRYHGPISWITQLIIDPMI